MVSVGYGSLKKYSRCANSNCESFEFKVNPWILAGRFLRAFREIKHLLSRDYPCKFPAIIIGSSGCSYFTI